jgi:hypothetical protein
MSAYSKFYFRPGKGEQIVTTLELSPDDMSAICGRVVDRDGNSAGGAVALLFRSDGCKPAPPEACFITDEDGQFFFGPLEGGTAYIIKVFKNHIKLRELEIITE